MKDIRQHFAQELSRALLQAGYEDRPGVLEREFNLRFHGEPVTYHGVRRWLQGETLPTPDKMRVLSRWLNLAIEPFADAAGGEAGEPVPRYAVSDTDQDVIQAYLCLNDVQRKAVAQMVFLLGQKN